MIRYSALLQRLAEYLIIALVWLVGRTTRKVWINWHIVEMLDRHERHYVFGLWHNNLMFLMYILGPRGLVTIISKSRDGDQIFRIATCFGVRAVRGSTSRGALVRLIEEEAKSGVFLTVLGYGMGNYKGSMLERLAGKGNGNHAYIDNIGEARKVLVEQIGGTMITIAKDVKIQVEFNPNTVAEYRLVGYETRHLNREDFNNLLVIFISLIAAFFSVTGIILYFDTFRKDDFLGLIPGDWWRKKAKLVVCAPHGEVVARIDALSGGRLYDELANADILLPSNCGGGGTCGLCVVSLDPSVPISAAVRWK